MYIFRAYVRWVFFFPFSFSVKIVWGNYTRDRGVQWIQLRSAAGAAGVGFQPREWLPNFLPFGSDSRSPSRFFVSFHHPPVLRVFLKPSVVASYYSPHKLVDQVKRASTELLMGRLTLWFSWVVHGFSSLEKIQTLHATLWSVQCR